MLGHRSKQINTGINAYRKQCRAQKILDEPEVRLGPSSFAGSILGFLLLMRIHRHNKNMFRGVGFFRLELMWCVLFLRSSHDLLKYLFHQLQKRY